VAIAPGLRTKYGCLLDAWLSSDFVSNETVVEKNQSNGNGTIIYLKERRD
jgi:hypothetical protein